MAVNTPPGTVPFGGYGDNYGTGTTGTQNLPDPFTDNGKAVAEAMRMAGIKNVFSPLAKTLRQQAGNLVATLMLAHPDLVTDTPRALNALADLISQAAHGAKIYGNQQDKLQGLLGMAQQGGPVGDTLQQILSNSDNVASLSTQAFYGGLSPQARQANAMSLIEKIGALSTQQERSGAGLGDPTSLLRAILGQPLDPNAGLGPEYRSPFSNPAGGAGAAGAASANPLAAPAGALQGNMAPPQPGGVPGPAGILPPNFGFAPPPQANPIDPLMQLQAQQMLGY
jgi:hypothetical protein